MGDFTDLLASIECGDRRINDELFSLVYRELRRLASSHLLREDPSHTLQPTALVHEAYLRLAGDENCDWKNRRHFFAAASEAMRRILVDRAREKAAVKRGGNYRRIDLGSDHLVDDDRSEDLIHLDEALTELERHDAEAAQLVKLRYFAGVSHQDAARALNVNRRQADRLWALAKVWLYRKLADEQ